VFPANMGDLIQRAWLVLGLAGHKQGRHSHDEVVVVLVVLEGKVAHKVHLGCGYAHYALVQLLACRRRKTKRLL